MKPGYFYVKKNIEHLMKDYEIRGPDKRTVKLFDSLGRGQDIGLEEIYSIWLKNPMDRRYMEYTSKSTGFDLFKNNQLKVLRNEYNNRLKEIMDKNYQIESKADFRSNIRDIHMIQLMKQLGLNPHKDIHLLMVIEDFVKEKEKESDWVFRIKPNGTNYWTNLKEQKASFDYPHLEELRETVDKFKLENPTPDMKAFLKKETVLSYITPL